MVGFPLDPTTEEDLNNQAPKLKSSENNNPLDLSSIHDLDDFSSSFADSFIDFDSIKDWIEEMSEPCMIEPKTEPDLVDSGKPELGITEKSCTEKVVENLNPFVIEPKIQPHLVDSVNAELGVSEKSIEMAEDGSCREKAVENPIGDGSEKLGNLGSLIEEEMGKVSLQGLIVASVVDNGDGKVSTGDESDDSSSCSSSDDDDEDDDEEKENCESESVGSSDSDSASSSSSSSSSDDEEDDNNENGDHEDEEEEKGEMDVEEGEIRDSEKMVCWSDAEDDDDVVKGPLMSKNELKDLPPVPPVDVTLQPHHQTCPVGVVLSIIGAQSQVIVEGVEKHNPLNMGSILWITETRCPLGFVDEIFGPVKNPYYTIRYNSENEIPAGIQMGTPISFVPEFVDHVLNDKNLYKKGYDASGENDEEVTDEAEFSDDEKEAEYKRIMKMTKRGTNDQNHGNKKKDRRKNNNRGGTWTNVQSSTPQTPAGGSQRPPDQNQHCSPSSVPQHQVNGLQSFGMAQGFAAGQGFIPPHPQLTPIPGFITPSNGVWTGGMAPQQPQNVVLTNGFPVNNMPWLQQNHQQQMSQMPFPNGMPFQQQFDLSQMLPSNVLQGGQPNVCAGPAFANWPGFVGQTGFNQVPFGVGFQPHPPINNGQQGFPQQNYDLQPTLANPGNGEASHQNFNQGTYFGNGGRRPYRRGGSGGRFGGGRNRQQPK